MARLEIMRNTNDKVQSTQQGETYITFSQKIPERTVTGDFHRYERLKSYYKRFLLYCRKYLRARLKLRPSKEKDQNMWSK